MVVQLFDLCGYVFIYRTVVVVVVQNQEGEKLRDWVIYLAVL